MKLIIVKKRTFFYAKSDPKRNGLKSITFILIFGIKVYKSERFESYEPLETSLPPRMKNPPPPPNKRTENNERHPLDMTKGFYPKNLKTNKDNLLYFSKENQRLKP